MNLHSVVRGAIRSVNPDISATLLRSAGYTTDATGKQIPAYAAPLTSNVQVQGVGGRDLQHMDALNIQGVMRKVYLYGNWQGVVRADLKGGDLMQFPQVPGSAVQSWKIVTVIETWPDWCKLSVVMQ